jgi:hypothetical protein
MPISDRTRKILWATAGGRCSICRGQLVSDRTDTDDPSVLGEECHIVAQSGSGPRAGVVAGVDSYDNLILLCRVHHKQIDDQTGYYTVSRLIAIKQAHEDWAKSVGETTRFGWVAEPRRAEERRRTEELIRERDHRFRVTVKGVSAPDNEDGEPNAVLAAVETRQLKPAQISGFGSKVIEVDLPRGGYRLSWLTDNGTSPYFKVIHETGKSGRGDEIVWEKGLHPKPGEKMLRIDDTGRHIFSVVASNLHWEICFTSL